MVPRDDLVGGTGGFGAHDESISSILNMAPGGGRDHIDANSVLKKRVADNYRSPPQLNDYYSPDFNYQGGSLENRNSA